MHSFVTTCLNYCLALHSGSPSVWLAFLDRTLYSAARTLHCIVSYCLNAQLQSCIIININKLHIENPALTPCPTSYRVQGRLLGVAVLVGPCSNLPIWSLSTCFRYSEVFASSAYKGVGCSQSHLPIYHYHQYLAFVWCAQQYGMATLVDIQRVGDKRHFYPYILNHHKPWVQRPQESNVLSPH